MSATDISASAHPNGVGGVTATQPTQQCSGRECQTRIHIGIFFDGTGNNQDWVENPNVNWRKALSNWWDGRTANTLTQLQARSDSNVARLFRSYPDDYAAGYFRLYVPGVGTPFPEIGEAKPETFGAACGAGGDGRINYAMLHVLNSMYRTISQGKRQFIPEGTVKALCSLGAVGINAKTGEPNMSAADRAALAPVKMDRKGGLLMDLSHNSHRQAFYRSQLDKLKAAIAMCPSPQLVEVFIDVFGFSRGAAEARAFCNWMDPLFDGTRLAGVTTHIRFLGLFDTVASVGIATSITAFTDGHQSWGDAPYLVIPARVRHCEHYVAMHENRGAFPLEDVRHAGRMPAHCRQYRFPGMHSDVGGGYGPADQGRGPRRQDDEKLSQIPLNRMYDAARAAQVPLDKDLAVGTTDWDCFAVSPALQDAYDAFLKANGEGGRALRDCLMDYLTWRIRARNDYPMLASTQRASEDDRDDLIGANRTLIEDVGTVTAAATIDQRLAAARSGHEAERLEQERDRLRARMASLSRFAAEVVERAQGWRAITPAEAHLFANYCHDSYAGFKPLDQPVAVGVDLPGTWESEGYLRYRTRYEGTDERLTMLPRAPGEPLPA